MWFLSFAASAAPKGRSARRTQEYRSRRGESSLGGFRADAHAHEELTTLPLSTPFLASQLAQENPSVLRQLRDRDLFGLRRAAKSLTKQELDRRHPSADVRHGNLDSPPGTTVAALEGDPMVANSAGRGVEQGLADALETFCGRFSEARANGGRITRAVLAHRRNVVSLAVRGHHHRRLRLDARSPAWKTLLQHVRTEVLDQSSVVDTELEPGETGRGVLPRVWLPLGMLGG
jgi:hypothetical protein